MSRRPYAGTTEPYIDYEDAEGALAYRREITERLVAEGMSPGLAADLEYRQAVEAWEAEYLR